MKQYYETKIGKIIASEFDSRMELAVFTYIIQNGYNKLKKIEESDIEEIKSDCNLMTDDFCKSLVRAAVTICKESTEVEFLEYTRCYLSFQPSVKRVTIYKDDFGTNEWETIQGVLDVWNDEQESIEFIAISANEN